ncbi:MAG: FAD-binding and (Fe-S)-binding domain-containing protein [Chloroflexota bacterium]|nr:FAD-binding protein [Chloroflexota bacterium]MBI5704146.1 FAD-binding protein [Chloroflexota bacterium]
MSLPPDFLNELRKHFTGDLRFDAASRILYSTDASLYQIEPLGVALPKTQDDLHAAVELAAKYKVPILPRGSGSSLGGQAIGHALILDFSRWLDAILEIDPESRTATLEPGVVLADLNAAAAKFGLTFGPDPASAERATMGGVIGNNATGAHSILYGMSADHILSADVILSDGSLAVWGEVREQLSVNSEQLSVRGVQAAILSAVAMIRGKYADAIKQNFPKPWRNSAGYRLNYLLPWSPSAPPRWNADHWSLTTSYPPIEPNTINLAPLLAGSEGTLAVIRRMKVNLVPKPKHTILGVLSYQSIAEACDDVPRLLGFKPSAIELIPQMILRLARSVPAYARQMGWVAGDPAAVLVVEFAGDRLEVLKEAVRALDAGRGALLTIAESKEEQARVWNVRKVGLGILDSRPQAARPAAFIEDCAIPVENLGEFVREVERIMAAHGTEGGIYAHASAGCLHIRPVLNLLTGEGVRALRSIGEQVFALTMRLGGSMSSEHGDGLARGEYIERTYGSEVTDAMRLLKRAADPDNLLNPGKLFDAPPMDTNLRYGDGYQVQVWEPSLHFNHERGLAGAIEQCNGQGVCRKAAGVMCPSFQATREEQNSTRGRANLLRALITSYQLPIFQKPELEQAVFAALDLCLACKGCKAECPSGVDMAKLKYEFESEYYKSHRRPLRDYLFGYFDLTAKLASSIAPLANAVTSVPLFRKAIAKAFGITAQRPFPKFSVQRAKVKTTVPQRDGEKAIFLSDPFGRYVEPEVEQAAFDVLAACGCDVHVLPIVGAGASLLSKGFVEAAKRQARRVLDALNQIDPQHEAVIVGIEPPDIYCLKNDYFDLLPERRDEIASISARTWLLDEYLIRSDGFHELRVANKIKTNNTSIAKQKIHFQPHCHQRAEGLADDGLPSGTSATVELLRLCGYEVETLDAGCCGMAGTFGYEAEHYELSMKVGEKLFNSKFGIQNPEIVCTGAACRMQVRQGMEADAVHPIMLVARALRE